MPEEISKELNPEATSFPQYARKTDKGSLEVPKSVVDNFPEVEHFRVSCEGGCIVLIPLDGSRGDEVRRKLKALGITEQDVADAVQWARGR